MQSGPLFSYVESTFSYSSKTFTQKLTIPQNSLKFYLNIHTFSNTGDEIFLKVFNSNSKKDWLYTFNSADVIKRYQFQKRANCFGENGFPVVSGLLVDYKSIFMQVYPKFPFGVHLADNDYFFIHLHRNPPNDDVLGLGSPLLDKLPAEHEFLVSFADKDPGRVWKEHLDFKHSPLVLTYDSADKLVTELALAKRFSGGWGRDVGLKVLDSDGCLYLSRVFFKKEEMMASVVNLCEKDLEFSINGWKAGREVQADGYDWTGERTDVQVAGELKFEINKNTPETLWKYYGARTKNISPFHLKTYQVLFNGTASQTTATKQYETPTFIQLESPSITTRPTDILFLSVIGLFGVSVLVVLSFSVYKLKSSKKLD